MIKLNNHYDRELLEYFLNILSHKKWKTTTFTTQH